MTNYAEDMAIKAVIRFEDEMMREIELPKGGPVLNLVAQSRLEAADALMAMISVSAEDSIEILRLQTEIRRHIDLIRWINSTVNAGRQAYALLKAEEAVAVQDALFYDGTDPEAEI